MVRTVDEYLALPYKFEIIKESDGTFFISVVEMEGCMSSGSTLDEAYEMIHDAMRAWIETCLEQQLAIPEPEAWEDNGYSGKFVVRLSKSLHKELVKTAEQEGVSLNHYVSDLLSRRCGVIETQADIIKRQSRLLRIDSGKEPAYQEQLWVKEECGQ